MQPISAHVRIGEAIDELQAYWARFKEDQAMRLIVDALRDCKINTEEFNYYCKRLRGICAPKEAA